MSIDLLLPSEEVARKLLEKVPYANRLPAGRLVMTVGLQQSHVRSLQEVHALLSPDASSLPAISLAALADWVDHIVGDVDLSEALRQVMRDALSYVDSCVQACDQIGDRLAQAHQVAGLGNA